MNKTDEYREPSEEDLRLAALINDPRNDVKVNEIGERDLSFMKQELTKPENAIWCEQEGYDAALRMSKSGHISVKQFGHFWAAQHQLWCETTFGHRSALIR